MDSRRKTIVINQEFQTRFSLLVVALSVVLINSIFIYRAVFDAEHALSLANSLTWGLVLAEMIVLAAVWYGSLKISYKIAGPVHVFAREGSKLETGDLTVQIALRDGDFFKSEAAQINAAVDGLRMKVDSLKDLSVQLQHAHASGADLNELLGELHNQLSAVITVPEEDDE